MRIVYIGETLGGEAGDLVEDDGAVFRERVPDAQHIVADDPDHIYSTPILDRLSLLAEEYWVI